MKKIVFDIETAGENFDEMDEVTQKALSKWIDRVASDEKEKGKLLKDLKNGTGFSPFTGEVVAIGVLDIDSKKGAVYYQNLQNQEESEKDGVKLKPMTEKEMLENFWRIAEHAEEFISFNGRGFDVPFLMIRSAKYGIRPTKNLMSNRYLNNQFDGAKHIDLMDQLTFYGAVRRNPNLHMVCRLLGVPSPKEEGVTGDNVTELFQEGKCLEIAEYNVRDLKSTATVYDYWNKYLRF
ncbi:MAG: ribonuclease H-like domain-containing protein [Patescibacteria group bacterium]|jgi:predicted PolB exonuclease-like 3'-5' exonuclease|nr:ribonuclease H-like domain-containing protein [Patescibacteria group bacterium]